MSCRLVFLEAGKVAQRTYWGRGACSPPHGGRQPCLPSPFLKGGPLRSPQQVGSPQAHFILGCPDPHVFVSHGVNQHGVHKRHFWFDHTSSASTGEAETRVKPQKAQNPVAMSVPQNWGSGQDYRTTLCNFTLWAWFLLWVMVYSPITRHLSLGLVLKSLLSQSIFSSSDDSPIFVPTLKCLMLQNPTVC